MSETDHQAAAVNSSPLFILCADGAADNQALLRYVIWKAQQFNARIGLFGCIQLQDFQNWASVEGTVRQELHEQCERELWGIAGQMRELGGPIAEFLIEEGSPLEALAKIIEKSPEIAEVIISLARKDVSDYQELALMQKLSVPLVFVPSNLR